MINFTSRDNGQALANMMRSDRIFASKNVFEKKLRKLIEGLAVEIARQEGSIQLLWDEYDVESTTDLIEQWESALGIPDDCFSIDGSLADRRENILTKLTSLGVSTEPQFIALGARLGFTIDIKSGVEALSFPYIFPVPFSSTDPKWTMLVEIETDGSGEVFPYTFPFILSEGERANLLVCLFKKLVPVNVNVIFKLI